MRQAFAFVSGVEDPERREMEGYHGNPIVVLSATLENNPDIARFWSRAKEHDVVATVLRELDRRLDDRTTLHLRFDKQEAYRERLRLASHDDVVTAKGKVAAYPAKRPIALEAARRYLEEV